VATNVGASSDPITLGKHGYALPGNYLSAHRRGQVDAAAPNDATNNLGFTAGSGYTVWPGC
jgi:hypothetical protein